MEKKTGCAHKSWWWLPLPNAWKICALSGVALLQKLGIPHLNGNHLCFVFAFEHCHSDTTTIIILCFERQLLFHIPQHFPRLLEQTDLN